MYVYMKGSWFKFKGLYINHVGGEAGGFVQWP